jgi:hypothetical protein
VQLLVKVVFFYARVGMDVWTNGGRFFAGMHATTVIGEPISINNTVGFVLMQRQWINKFF